MQDKNFPEFGIVATSYSTFDCISQLVLCTMIGQFSSLATSYNTFDCISQFVCALWLGSLVGNISLFAPVNSKVCLNWNLLPLFDPRGVTSLYCKLQSVVFFHSDLWAWRLGHESKHKNLVSNLQYGPWTWLERSMKTHVSHLEFLFQCSCHHRCETSSMLKNFFRYHRSSTWTTTNIHFT